MLFISNYRVIKILLTFRFRLLHFPASGIIMTDRFALVNVGSMPLLRSRSLAKGAGYFYVKWIFLPIIGTIFLLLFPLKVVYVPQQLHPLP